MKERNSSPATSGGAALLLACLLSACETGGGDTASRQVQAYVQGTYAGAPIATTTAGNISTLNVIQTGADLQVIDNYGRLYTGDMTAQSTEEATFNLTGNMDSAGPVHLCGTFTASGDSWIMQGTLIADTWTVPLYGTTQRMADTRTIPADELGDYSGCCSSHNGISGTYDAATLSLYCNDGTLSPTCTYGQ